MKICPKCKKEKTINEFNKHKTRITQTYCKTCQRIIDKLCYKKTKHKHIMRKAKTWKKRQLWYREYKKQFKCSCGENDPRCIDFHHRDPKTKSYDVSDMLSRGFSKQKIIKEIEKCDSMCSNCHRKLTIEKY